jgi:hypothetical protein
LARLDITMEHHQAPEVAQAKLQAAVHAFQARYSQLIDRLNWADDGRSATIAGSGYEVRCWYDERAVHVQGTIPLAWKLFEGTIRSHIKHDIERSLSAHHQ